MLNVMSDPIIRVELANGQTDTLNLPDTYAHLVENDLKSFQALRTHQKHGLHAFLVQLGVLALRQTGQTNLPVTPQEWHSTLRALTQRQYRQDQPWQLVNPNWEQPGFLQSPCLPNEMDKYKRVYETPDMMDQLITSDNHKMKQNEATQAHHDDWLFALINLQTMQGALGRYNYGISRMNSGASSRPVFTLTPMGRPGAAVTRDINALIQHNPNPDPDGKPALLWTMPWQGLTTDQAKLEDLSDLYIEICRRIRVEMKEDGTLTARQAGTDTTRIAKIQPQRADTDPWTPFDVKNTKTLTISDPAFTYRHIANYLTSEQWQWPLLLHPTAQDIASDQPMAIHAAALARGNGVTDGYFERTIQLDPKTVQAMAEEDHERLNAVTQTHLKDAQTTINILRHAILTYLSPNITNRDKPERAPASHTRIVEQWEKPMNQKIDTVFFQYLQQELAADDEQEAERSRTEWQLWLYEQAKLALQDSQNNVPQSVNAARAATRSNSLFESRIRAKTGLTLAFPPKEAQPEDEAASPNDQAQPQAATPDSAPATYADVKLNVQYQNDENDRQNNGNQETAQPLPDTSPTSPVYDPNQTYAQRMSNKAVAIASQLSSWQYSQGDLAELRRMNLNNPTAPAFHRLLVSNEITLSAQNQLRWALIIKGIAVMTHNGTGLPHEPTRISPHNPYISVGQAMHNGAPGNNRIPFLHPNRFQLLMNAQRQNLTAKLASFFQMARSEHLKVNCRQLALYILAQGQEAGTARAVRLRITQDYYRAEYSHERNDAYNNKNKQEQEARA